MVDSRSTEVSAHLHYNNPMNLVYGNDWDLMLDLVQLYNQDPTISQGTEKTTGAGLLISSWVSTRLFPSTMVQKQAPWVLTGGTLEKVETLPCSCLLKSFLFDPLPAAHTFLMCVYASFPTGGNIRKHLRGKSVFLRKGHFPGPDWFGQWWRKSGSGGPELSCTVSWFLLCKLPSFTPPEATAAV